jgi:SAM-dependent methyltransferase
MKVRLNEPPRVFTAGFDKPVTLKDCGRIELLADELVTFVTESGAEYDITRKDWGFYATPSLNGRLRQFNLRAVLVRNRVGRYFVLLVEKGQEPAFERYVASEQLAIVTWMDSAMALGALSIPAAFECLCGGGRFATVFVYDEPPAGEVRFAFSEGHAYHREVIRCAVCGHFLSWHTMDADGMYGGAYADATYPGDALRRTFDRIIALDPAKSDNIGRVAHIAAFMRDRLPSGRAPRVLDVGSGLCVFLHRMKAEGWDGTALDPDPRAAAHARDVVGVQAVAGDFMKVDDLGRFDLVSFNKVLEHVLDPVAMLARSALFLEPGGVVYVELPDGEMAVHDGPGREEFFVEHHHVFSFASFSILAARAGFRVLALERLKEPSTKYTLRGFLALG